MTSTLALLALRPYLGLNGTTSHEGIRILEMIEHLCVNTLIRVSGPRVFALMGVVRPGTWIFGADVAGGRAP